MGVKKALNINEFALLLLAILAQNSKYINLNQLKGKTIRLPSQYKQNIENILCADNGWKEEFSRLIDINEYFDDHFGWETLLSCSIENIITKMHKVIKYEIVQDMLLIEFTQNEIDTIFTHFDTKTKDTMNHFANLIVDYIYTRRFQEEFIDYSARSVRKMHELNEDKKNGEMEIETPKVLKREKVNTRKKIK